MKIVSRIKIVTVFITPISAGQTGATRRDMIAQRAANPVRYPLGKRPKVTTAPVARHARKAWDIDGSKNANKNKTYMTYHEALDKAAKLLRLSTSPNANEAALALAKAQEIMERFKIDANSLALDQKAATPDEPIKNFGDDPLDAQGGTWRWRLASPLAKANQCKLYLSGGRPCLVGRPSDVATVRYFYSWLVREIDSLTRRECAGNGRTYSNNFRLGVVETVSIRLKAQKEELHATMRQEAAEQTNANGMALMRLNMSIARIEQRASEVEQWTKDNMRLGRASATRSRYDSSARDAGRRAGHSIRIQPSAGSIRGASKAYLS